MICTHASDGPPLKRGAICLSALTAPQWRMPEFTRRRSSDAPDEYWHVFYDDVRVGTIAIRTGIRARCPDCTLESGKQEA